MQALEKAQRQQPPVPAPAQHTPVVQAGFEGHEMPPVPPPSGEEQLDNAPRTAGGGGGKPMGLVKGFSVTGPPSLTTANPGFSVVSRGNGKAGTKIF